MYFSRMAREDAIVAFTEALLVVGLWRFISERRPWDFYLACAGFALMFTIKETAYIIAVHLRRLPARAVRLADGPLVVRHPGRLRGAGRRGRRSWAQDRADQLPSIANQDPTSADIRTSSA